MKIALLVILIFLVNYALYQNVRNVKIHSIRVKWILEDNPKYRKYSFDDMRRPSLKNWFSLKFPTENDFT